MSQTKTERQLRMHVGGMTCTDCEVHVSRALRAAGATEASADFRRGEARLLIPGGVSEATLATAVREAGYQPGRIEEVASPTISPRLTPTERSGSPETYDLAIVGSGGGAFAAAIRARDRGARVVMIERGTIGGTCVNIGCIPSKTLLKAGDAYWEAGHGPFTGISTEAGPVDLAALVGQKDQLVTQLRQEKYLDLIGDYGWDLLRGEAQFGEDGILRVNGDVIQSNKVLLATGASPAVPLIPGLADVDYLTSTSALALTELPKSLVVIGSGYVALELGQLFHHLGSKVTLMQRSPRILKTYDPEISEVVAEALTEQGITFATGARFDRVEKTNGRVRVHVIVDGVSRVVEGDRLLVATGRAPNTAALGLDRAGVALGTQGEILVNEHLQTSNPIVYAAGDVTLAPQFVYVAAYEGALAAENALEGNRRTVDLRALPGVTFTKPAIATVGLTEAQAKEKGYAVKFHLTVRDLVETFAPYLTMSEGLKLAAQTFGHDVSKLSCCAA